MDSPIAFVETPYLIAKLMVQLITKSKNSKILDSGSGKGVFIKCLLDNGFKNVEGIEICDNYANYCNEKYGITIHNKNYLTFSPNKKYDVIIGNPPYNHYNALPENIKENIVNITKTKESDIYYAFILKSIELLNDGGELIYIVPYSFFYNTYAKIVRETMLKNGYIELIIDLDETRLFKGENPETIIFKFVKNKSKKCKSSPYDIKILKIIKNRISLDYMYKKAIEALTYKKSNDVFKYYEKEHFKSRNIWSSHNPKVKINDYILLKDVAKVCVGLVSGFEEGFRINDEENEQYNNKEKELIKKFVKAKNCKGFYIDGYVKYLLTNEIPNDDYLKEEYPNIYNKLIAYKEKMENRYLPKNKKWFHWQALRNKKIINENINNYKIFVPTLDRSLKNRFSLTNKPYYPSGDVIAIIPKNINPYFLVGYLNSNFFRDYYLAEGGRRGGRISYTQKLLSNVKIPKFDDEIIIKIANISKEIIRNKDNSKSSLIDEIIMKHI